MHVQDCLALPCLALPDLDINQGFYYQKTETWRNIYRSDDGTFDRWAMSNLPSILLPTGDLGRTNTPKWNRCYRRIR